MKAIKEKLGKIKSRKLEKHEQLHKIHRHKNILKKKIQEHI